MDHVIFQSCSIPFTHQRTLKTQGDVEDIQHLDKRIHTNRSFAMFNIEDGCFSNPGEICKSLTIQSTSFPMEAYDPTQFIYL